MDILRNRMKRVRVPRGVYWATIWPYDFPIDAVLACLSPHKLAVVLQNAIAAGTVNATRGVCVLLCKAVVCTAQCFSMEAAVAATNDVDMAHPELGWILNMQGNVYLRLMRQDVGICGGLK